MAIGMQMGSVHHWVRDSSAQLSSVPALRTFRAPCTTAMTSIWSGLM
jgi:hypothetical protein